VVIDDDLDVSAATADAWAGFARLVTEVSWHTEVRKHDTASHAT
jgi:hypothetical protein